MLVGPVVCLDGRVGPPQSLQGGSHTPLPVLVHFLPADLFTLSVPKIFSLRDLRWRYKNIPYPSISIVNLLRVDDLGNISRRRSASAFYVHFFQHFFLLLRRKMRERDTIRPHANELTHFLSNPTQRTVLNIYQHRHELILQFKSPLKINSLLKFVKICKTYLKLNKIYIFYFIK